MSVKKLKTIILKTGIKYVALNISNFCDWMLVDNNLFEPITDRYILQTGYYGDYYGVKIYVLRDVSKNYIRFGINENIRGSCDINIDTPLKDIKKIFKLKAFW